MDRDEVLFKVAETIREVLDEEDIEVTYETTANDVDGWDSLTHISIIHEIESVFHIKFSIAEIQGMKNTGELVDSIIRHVGE